MIAINSRFNRQNMLRYNGSSSLCFQYRFEKGPIGLERWKNVLYKFMIIRRVPMKESAHFNRCKRKSC